MKIKTIKIDDYKNLKTFEIHFENNVSIIVGKNGSGKSNFFEFITDRFFDLHRKTSSQQHPNYIVYEHKGIEISIDDNIEDSMGTISSNGKSFDTDKDDIKTILPKNIICYYSGHNNKLNKFKLPISTAAGIIEYPIFVLSSDYYKILLLSFLYSSLERDKLFIRDNLGISGFEEVSIICNNSVQLRGKYNVFLETLKSFGTTGIAMIGNAKGLSIKLEKTSFEDVDFRQSIGYEKDFFMKLYDVVNSNILILDKLEILIKLDNGTIISSEDLSEGQKQFIIVNGIVEFFSDEENLFLLDEPDTFLHPNRQKELVGKIKKSRDGTTNKSHAIICTHSPLVVGSNDEIDIIGLENHEGESQIVCHTNPKLFKDNKNISSIDVYGNKAEFIYEKIFGLESTRANGLYEEAKILHELILKEKLTQDEKEKIKDIKEIIKKKLGDDPKDSFLSYLDKEDIIEIIKKNHEENK